MLLLFVFFLVKYLIKNIKIGEFDKKNLLYLIFVIIFSIFFVFIFLKGSVYGRFPDLRIMLGNIFIKKIFEQTLVGDPKTYSMVVYAILQQVFHIKITPITLFLVNKVISVFLLIVVFLISKIIFKKNWVSLLVLVSFVSSSFIQKNLFSIEHGTAALFFTYVSILFLLKFVKEQNLIFFMLSNISLILAAYYRYELSFLFGIPYIAYYCIFLNKYKKTRRYMLFTISILLLIVMAVVMHFTLSEDKFLLGEKIKEKGIAPLIKNSAYILEHNIFVEKNLLLKSGNISIFTYFGFVVSIIIIITLLYHLIKREKLNQEYKWISIFAFYAFFYFIFQISFNMEGLSKPWKTSVNYFLCEIILTYFAVSWLVNKAMRKKPKYLMDITKFTLMTLFFLVAIISTSALTFNMHPQVEAPVVDMVMLKKNVDFDYSCKIIKTTSGQPLLDYYYSAQENSIFFGKPPGFYESVDKYDKKGKCFYYYNEFFTKYNYNGSMYVHRIDFKKVDQLFRSCDKSIEFESSLKNRPFSLIKYKC